MSGPATDLALPPAVRRAIVEIGGAAGAWCPALSPEGRHVAYVTDRSGAPALEVAPVDGPGAPVLMSGPGEEVVSVAWSPDGGWLAYLVSPSGSICAELHVVAADGTGSRLVAGEDQGATVFAGGWTGPSTYACSIAPVTDRDMLAMISPMTAVERLQAPVLLAHGDRDTNVPVLESVQLHQELQALGATSDLLLPGEGHTIVGRRHVVELTERVVAWFDRWL